MNISTPRNVFRRSASVFYNYISSARPAVDQEQDDQDCMVAFVMKPSTFYWSGKFNTAHRTIVTAA